MFVSLERQADEILKVQIGAMAEFERCIKLFDGHSHATVAHDLNQGAHNLDVVFPPGT